MNLRQLLNVVEVGTRVLISTHYMNGENREKTMLFFGNINKLELDERTATADVVTIAPRSMGQVGKEYIEILVCYDLDIDKHDTIVEELLKENAR